jgi:hypothetical protein
MRCRLRWNSRRSTDHAVEVSNPGLFYTARTSKRYIKYHAPYELFSWHCTILSPCRLLLYIRVIVAFSRQSTRSEHTKASYIVWEAQYVQDALWRIKVRAGSNEQSNYLMYDRGEKSTVGNAWNARQR